MSETTEMMLEGILCECCGVFLGPYDPCKQYWEPSGVPTKCEDCEVDDE